MGQLTVPRLSQPAPGASAPRATVFPTVPRTPSGRRRRSRSNRVEYSFGSEGSAGGQSQVWTIWAQKGRSSIYVKASRGQDIKVSLHDPAESRTRLPWVFGASPEYMEKHNDPVRTPNKTIVRWGPFGRYPGGRVEALRILLPSGELYADPVEGPIGRGDVCWRHEPPCGHASAFTVAFEPLEPRMPAPEGADLWRHDLGNGHRAVLSAETVLMSDRLLGVLRRQRAHLFDCWARDVADGRLDPGEPGHHARFGMYALPPEGHRLTIVEWLAASYWLGTRDPSETG